MNARRVAPVQDRMRRFSCLVLLALVAACGGSGSSSTSDPNAPGGPNDPNGPNGPGGGPNGMGDPNHPGGGPTDPPVPAAGPVCSKDAWCWEHPSPQGETLFGVWGSGAKDVWAVGENGTLLHDVGGGFTRVAIDTTAKLLAVHGTGATDVWIAGDDGVVYHGDGKIFAKATSQDKVHFAGILAIAPNDVWAAGYRSTTPSAVLLHFDGKAWTPVTTSANNAEHLRGMWASSPTDLYVSSDFGIHHFDGKAWSKVSVASSFASFDGVWGTSAKDVWAYGSESNDPAAYHFDGTSWTKVAFPIKGSWIASMHGSSANDAYAVTYKGIAHWDGKAFSDSTLGFTPPNHGFYLNGVFAPKSGRPVAVGQPGAPLYFDKGAWTAGMSHSAFVRSFSGDATNLIAVGQTTGWESPQLLRRKGGAWTTEKFSGFDDVNALYAVTPTELWAVGGSRVINVSPIIQRFDGTSWTSLTNGLPANDLYDVWGAGANDVWVAGINSLAHYDGKKFTNYASSLSTRPVYIRNVKGFASNDVWATGWTSSDPNTIVKLVVHWDGTSWTQKTDGNADDSYGIFGAAPNDVWVLGKQLLHWNGSTFTTLPSPDGRKLYNAWGKSPNDVYAVGENGVIAHWDGTAWTVQASGTGHSLWGIWGDGKEVLVGGDGGVVLRHAL